MKNYIFKLKQKIPDKYKIAIKYYLKNFKALIFYDDLNKLAEIYGTDKWGDHYYTQHYQFHLRKFKYKKIKLLEIGVGGRKHPNIGGNSLRMWKRYFPFGQIYSVDIYDKSALQERRIRIFQGDQSDVKFLNDVVMETGELDIIIDDGSHVNDHVIKSFEKLFPYLKEGGMYIIEDLETSYRHEYGGDSKMLENPNTSMNYFKTFPDRLNREEFNIKNFSKMEYEESLYSIHFYHNLIVIQKSCKLKK